MSSMLNLQTRLALAHCGSNPRGFFMVISTSSSAQRTNQWVGAA
jgi:hypothetical protein